MYRVSETIPFKVTDLIHEVKGVALNNFGTKWEIRFKYDA